MSLLFASIPPKRLAFAITSASSTFILNNIKSFDGENDVAPSDLGTQHYVCFRNDTGTIAEFMEIDPATLIAGGPITIVRRGLNFYGNRTLETTALKLDFPANTICMLGTDVPQIFQYLKEYIDAAAIAGAVPASTTAAGIVVEASQAEVNAGTITKTISAVVYKLFAPLDKLLALFASETQQGLVEEATDAEVTAGTATGATGAKLFITPAKLLTRTNTISAAINLPFIEQEIPINSGTATIASSQYVMASNTTGSVLFIAFVLSTATTTANIYRLTKDSVSGKYYITHSTTLTITAGTLAGIAVTSSSLFVLCQVASVDTIRRYDIADLANVTTFTYSGGTIRDRAFSDGTDLYIRSAATTFDRYTLAGTIATNAGTVTFTGSHTQSGATSDGTNVWIVDATTNSTINGTGLNVNKYALAGGAIVSSTTMKLWMNAYLNWFPTNSGQVLFMTSSRTLGIGGSYSEGTTITGTITKIMAITLP